MLNGLDLFSGIGGITIALKDWIRPVAYCEYDSYAQGVLLSRMADGELPRAPIWDDVRTLKGGDLPPIDIVYGGFPCQDISCAGARKGLDGERTGLFREAIRLVRECEPKFVFIENVPGIRRYVPSVRGELEALGYHCRDGFLSAAEVGVPHIRNRWWLLAYSSRGIPRAEQEQIKERKGTPEPSHDGKEEPLANANSAGSTARYESTESGAKRIGRSRKSHQKANWWATEPDVGRVADGVSNRVDRLRALGNAVVPLQAREAFKILMGIK